MTAHLALLRGINVGGHNRMKMADLRELFEALGYAAVETYIQSGNVVFDSADVDEIALRDTLHTAVEEAFGYDVRVMIRTPGALAAVVEGSPFDGSERDGIKRYVTFLHEEPTAARREAPLAAKHEAESSAVRGRNVYSELDKEALGDGRFTDGGKTLGMPATRRTWSVVTALLDLAR